ncbi:MAG: hypothetical protein LBK54_07310 [Propionibacteriaceae bacterium]|jgi:hypothetical protein|nr:hypothetical protein [Propionibacteriaceae bacterium]
MENTFNPYTRRVLSEGRFPFSVPKETLTARDERAIQRAAKAERARLLRLDPGEMTPVMRLYQDTCQAGQIEVHRQRVEHVRNVIERRTRAEAIFDRDPVPPEPEIAPVPPASGLDRQVWLADKRRAIRAQSELNRREEEIYEARIIIEVCGTDLEAIDYLASFALGQWASHYKVLFQLHMHAAIGRNNENPTLRHLEFNAYQPLDTGLEPLSLEASGPKATRALEANRVDPE